jgi:hypothetical protein
MMNDEIGDMIAQGSESRMSTPRLSHSPALTISDDDFRESCVQREAAAP